MPQNKKKTMKACQKKANDICLRTDKEGDTDQTEDFTTDRINIVVFWLRA
jgi:hypothetical protein